MCRWRNGSLSKVGKEGALQRVGSVIGNRREARCWNGPRHDDFQVVSLHQNKVVNLSEP